MDPVSARGLASVSIPQNQSGLEDVSKSAKSGFKDVMNDSSKAAQKTSDVAPEPVSQAQKTEKSTKIDTFVDGIRKDEKAIDKMMARAQKGADFSNAELLQMQGVTYRYAQRVELATKVVEKVTGGLKQILNTQV